MHAESAECNFTVRACRHLVSLHADTNFQAKARACVYTCLTRTQTVPTCVHPGQRGLVVVVHASSTGGMNRPVANVTAISAMRLRAHNTSMRQVMLGDLAN